jgi:hypothetical protein
MNFHGAQVKTSTGENVARSLVTIAAFKFLRDNGYEPVLDENGDVRFEAGGLKHVLSVCGNDAEFLLIVLRDLWPLETGRDRSAAIRASARATARTRGVKVCVVRGTVEAAFEMFIVRLDEVGPVLPRAIDALRSATRAFALDMLRLTTGSRHVPEA